MDDRPILLIQRKWDIKLPNNKTIKQIPIHIESFADNNLPFVSFHIFSGVSENGTLAIIVTKTPCEPAQSTIKVSIDDYEKKIVGVGHWICHCIIDDIDYNNNNPTELLNRNIMTIEIEIAWYGFVKSIDTPAPALGLYHHTKKLYGTNNLTDMTLVIDDQEIFAHKVILASQSSVFMSMIRTKMLHQSSNFRITITDIDIITMKRVLEFLYSGKINDVTDTDDIFTVMTAAERFKIENLKKKCEDFLSTKVTINNSLELLESVSEYNSPRLMEFITNFMVNNRYKISILEEFEDLYVRRPELLFSFVQRAIRKKN